MKEAILIGAILVGLFFLMRKTPSSLPALDISMPNTRDIPQCPLGTNRRKNGLDCKINGDRFGL